MTAAQKIAKEKFKKAIAYRQKTGVSLKEAFAHIYGKKTVKKKAAKKVGYSKTRLKQEKGITKVLKSTPRTMFPYTAEEKIIKAGKKYYDAKSKGLSGTKRKKKKPSEQSILNKIHIVKDTVNKLDEAQHKHMMSGLTKIVGKIFNKYYVEFMHPNGYKFREYYNKYPTNRFVGVDRYIYVPKLTQKGTSLVALKHSKTDKQVKK